MGALANAVQLLRDDTLRQYAAAAAGYTARSVLAESDATPNAAARKWLAQQVLVNTRFQSDLFITAIATDPAIATLGVTLGDGKAISEAVIINAMAELWTPVALLSRPPTAG